MPISLMGNLLARLEGAPGPSVRLDVQLSPDLEEPPPWHTLDAELAFVLPDLQATCTCHTYTAFVDGFLSSLRQILTDHGGQATLFDDDPCDVLTVSAATERGPYCLVRAHWRDLQAVGAPLDAGEYSEQAPLDVPRESAIMWLVEGMCVTYEEIELLAAYLERVLSTPGLTIDQDLY